LEADREGRFIAVGEWECQHSGHYRGAAVPGIPVADGIAEGGEFGFRGARIRVEDVQRHGYKLQTSTQEPVFGIDRVSDDGWYQHRARLPSVDLDGNNVEAVCR
jgi:hypothetical protein